MVLDKPALEKILKEIFFELKINLFLSNGTMYGRNWADLSPRYKKIKEVSSPQKDAYPINVFIGNMLEALIKALKINVRETETGLSIVMSIDTDDIDQIDTTSKGVKAETANKNREFISFSDEEKNLICETLVARSREWIVDAN